MWDVFLVFYYYDVDGPTLPEWPPDVPGTHFEAVFEGTHTG